MKAGSWAENSIWKWSDFAWVVVLQEPKAVVSLLDSVTSIADGLSKQICEDGVEARVTSPVLRSETIGANVSKIFSNSKPV